MVLKQLDVYMEKKMDLSSYLTAYRKINLKWMLNLIVRDKTIQIFRIIQSINSS